MTFGSGAEIGTPYLLSAREMGIANLGGTGHRDRRRAVASRWKTATCSIVGRGAQRDCDGEPLGERPLPGST